MIKPVPSSAMKTYWQKADKRIAELQAENQRLREALKDMARTAKDLRIGLFSTDSQEADIQARVQGTGTIEIPGGPVPLIIKLGLNGSLTFPPGIDPVAALREAMMSFWEALGPVKYNNPQEADQ